MISPSLEECKIVSNPSILHIYQEIRSLLTSYASLRIICILCIFIKMSNMDDIIKCKYANCSHIFISICKRLKKNYNFIHVL